MLKLNASLATLAVASIAATATLVDAADKKFTGFYLGANAGYATAKHDLASMSGPVGGLHGGYGYTFNNGFHLGFDLMGTISGVKKSFELLNLTNERIDANTVVTGKISAEIKQKYKGSAAIRLGYEVDKLLPYAKLGAGISSFEVIGKAEGTINGGPNQKKEVKVAEGALASFDFGAGLQYAVTSNVLAGVEYTYSKYKSLDALTKDTGLSGHDIRARLTYKF